METNDTTHEAIKACRYCGSILIGGTLYMEAKQIKPRPGQVAICRNCWNMDIFLNEEGDTRPPDAEEQVKIDRARALLLKDEGKTWEGLV